MLSLISAAFQEGAPVLRPGEIDGHFVLRLEDNPYEAPGLLIKGGKDPLLTHLTRHIDRAEAVDGLLPVSWTSG